MATLIYVYYFIQVQIDGTVVKNLPANAGDTRELGSISGLGRSSGVRNGNPHQYSCLENSMDRGVWWATIHEVAELDMTEQLSMHMYKLSQVKALFKAKCFKIFNRYYQIILCRGPAKSHFYQQCHSSCLKIFRIITDNTYRVFIIGQAWFEIHCLYF